MNSNIQQLYSVAGKSNRLILGLMSGTSLDGLDLALCRISGSGLDTKLELLQFKTVPYDEAFKKEIRSVFAQKNIELENLCALHPWIARHHAAIINECLQKWKVDKSSVDCIASHGQTIYHAPLTQQQQGKFGNSTLQLGDGDHLAHATGILTISDFRQKHIAAGGEGAPLAVYGDYLVFSKKGEDRILLNIGGIANFTYLPGSMNVNEIFSSDLGPGNTLLDAWMRRNFPGTSFDQDGAVALKGKVNNFLLAALKSHEFFNLGFPKTTGPELFNLFYLESAVMRSGGTWDSVEDIMATLVQFSADTIADGILQITKQVKQVTVFSSGGGMHNPVLMEKIREKLPACDFKTTGSFGIDPDAKEAVLFALLANETLAGDPGLFGAGSGGLPAVSMGKISFPR